MDPEGIASLPDLEGPGESETVKVKRVDRPKPVFFYEREQDGMVFAAEEQEAANMIKHTDKDLRPKYLGWSDGTAFVAVYRKHTVQVGKVYSREEAGKISKEAFAAELAVAKSNMKAAKENQTPIVRPSRMEDAVQGSIPAHLIGSLLHGKRYESI